MITFPTAPEVFNAYQEQLIGRKQSEKEKGVVPPGWRCSILLMRTG